MNPNIDTLYFINKDIANPFFDAIMPQLTNVGGFVALICLCIVAILICRYMKKEKYLQIAKLCLYALVLSGIIVASLKLLVHEPRPYTVLSGVRQLVVPTEPNSFPSGHTSSTFSVVTVLVGKLKENRILCAILILFCVLIAFSRIYCGMHYPSDVVVGAIVGIASGIIVLKVKV